MALNLILISVTTMVGVDFKHLVLHKHFQHREAVEVVVKQYQLQL